MKSTIRIGRYNVSLINAIAFAASLCFLLAFFSKLFGYDIDWFFSSDCLYLPSIYKDLFTDGNSLEGWTLNPAPNFFPDMSVYFLLMLLCKNSFLISSFAFAIIQYTAILYLSSRIFKAILPEHSKHWHGMIYLLFSLFLMEYLFFTGEYYYSFYLVSNAFHTGSFVMALLCFLLSVHYYKTPSYKTLAVILVMSLLCIISDRLFIVLYCIPVVLSAFFLIGKVPLKNLLSVALTIVVATLGGLKVFEFLCGLDSFRIDNPHRLFAYAEALNSWDLFSGQMQMYMSHFGFKAITIYLFLLSFIATVVLFFRAGKRNHTTLYYYTVFSIVFSIVVFSAPVINGNYTGYDTLRYNVYPFYLMALNIPICLAYSIRKQHTLSVGKKVLATVCLVFLVGGMLSINRTGLKNYFTYYPQTVKTMDQLAEKNGLLCGVANYWEAKKITMFSKKGLRVYAVFDDLSLEGHVANTNWFFKGNFNFILTNNFRDTTLYKNNVAWLQPIANTANLGLLKTNTFTYRKDNGALPINNSGSE